MDRNYGVPEEQLAHYTCFRAPGPVRVDGRLDEEAWRAAPPSPPFVDLVTGEPAPLETRVACLWDDRAFYVGFRVEEPDVRATLTARDSFVWNDNDVEAFIAGDDCYYRVAFSRFEPLGPLGGRPAPAWSLNPHGVYDSHIPESFSCVHFTERLAGAV